MRKLDCGHEIDIMEVYYTKPQSKGNVKVMTLCSKCAKEQPEFLKDLTLIPKKSDEAISKIWKLEGKKKMNTELNTIKRRRGRPKGSKNKSKSDISKRNTEEQSIPKEKQRGRPKGSKGNKKAVLPPTKPEDYPESWKDELDKTDEGLRSLKNLLDEVVF